MPYEERNDRGSRGSYRGREDGGRDDARRDDDRRGGGDKEEKKFLSRFNLRGIICKDKDGKAVSVIKTKSGSYMGFVSIMVNRYSPGPSGGSGNDWNITKEYFKVIAFGKTLDALEKEIEAHAIVDFVGTIKVSEYQGKQDIRFFVDTFKIISAPRENSGRDDRDGGRRDHERDDRGDGRDDRRDDRGSRDPRGSSDRRGEGERPSRGYSGGGRDRTVTREDPPAPSSEYVSPVEDDIPF